MERASPAFGNTKFPFSSVVAVATFFQVPAVYFIRETTAPAERGRTVPEIKNAVFAFSVPGALKEIVRSISTATSLLKDSARSQVRSCLHYEREVKQLEIYLQVIPAHLK